MVVGDGFRAEQVAGSERSNPGKQNCFTLNQLPSSLFLFPVMDLLSYVFNCGPFSAEWLVMVELNTPPLILKPSLPSEALLSP